MGINPFFRPRAFTSAPAFSNAVTTAWLLLYVAAPVQRGAAKFIARVDLGPGLQASGNARNPSGHKERLRVPAGAGRLRSRSGRSQRPLDAARRRHKEKYRSHDVLLLCQAHLTRTALAEVGEVAGRVPGRLEMWCQAQHTLDMLDPAFDSGFAHSAVAVAEIVERGVIAVRPARTPARERPPPRRRI